MSTALSSSSLSPPCHGGSYREGVWTIARRKTRQRAMDSEHVTICKSVCPDFLTIRVVALAIATFGWQPTAKVMGLVLLVVIVPLSCWITDSLERRGLTMDGDPPGGPQDPARPATVRRHRRAPPAWRPPEEYRLGQTLHS